MVELGFNPYLLGLACTTFSLSYTFSVHVLLLPVLYSLMKWSLSIMNMKNFQPQKTQLYEYNVNVTIINMKRIKDG